MRHILLIWLVCGAALCFGAEVYPARPVRLIASFGPGSTVDLIARVVAQQLSEQLGKSFVEIGRAHV